MLVQDNVKHINALTAIAEACSSIRVFEVRDMDRYYVDTLLNRQMIYYSMTRLLAVTRKEHTGGINVPLGGKWYARLNPTINGKYAAYDLILCTNDKRKNECWYDQHYNAIGGYWYTPAYLLTKAGSRALESRMFKSLLAIVRAFNSEKYYI